MNMIVRDFQKVYKDSVVSLCDINASNRIIHIKGKNGSGKSTLLKAVANLISYQGKIEVGGRFSFMSEAIIFPKDISLKYFLNTMLSLEDYSIVEYHFLIDHFNMSEVLDKNLDELSKGTRAKVQLLICLVHERDFYILDEPFSGLDQQSVKKLIEYIEQSKKSFLISSHIDISFQCDCEVIHL